MGKRGFTRTHAQLRGLDRQTLWGQQVAGPLFQIQFLEGKGIGLFGGVVSDGEILCMSLVE